MCFVASVKFNVLSFTSEEIEAFSLKCKLLVAVVFVYIRKIKTHASLYWLLLLFCKVGCSSQA